MTRRHRPGSDPGATGHPARLVTALRHPRWGLAARGAVAASLAWLAGELAPAPLSDYAYYAPLGAVAATSSTTIRSARESAHAMIAVLLGAAIALGIDRLGLPGTLAVGLVVGVTMLFAAWRALGEMGSWAVTAGLFVLLLGSAHDLEYPTAFAGLLLVGAAIGVVLNLIAPPLPLTPSDVALDRLRRALVEQVGTLASQLESDGPLAADEWEERRRALVPTLRHTEDAVAHLREATRANRREHRFRERTTTQIRRADRLGVSAEVVDDVVRLLADWERRDRTEVAFGPDLRPALAAALRAYARALARSAPDGQDEPDEEVTARFTGAVRALSDEVGAAGRTPGHDYFVAAALIVALRRGSDALRAS
ncbi:FUSC family protein [Myceligenerans pegani]|uniref:FUSC family protein n=1 Tax=Myceligenerans pegani TaxID=2776917 RepID=A0ABR9MXV9_9MICO|nr:hypothetical protein [Myceligenerans sp. TRM 65318]MBE1876223.1 hypothetical protein [Myceligenerans sp. TRM 65318]MBE3018494.1 hypothetical protein [Myceligenerans sp. TRM 65318]